LAARQSSNGSMAAGGIFKPAMPLRSGVLPIGKERRHAGAVRVAIIPLPTPHLDGGKVVRGGSQSILRFRQHGSAVCEERQARKPAELEREQVIIQGLLAVPAVGRKLAQDLRLPSDLKSGQRRSPAGQVGPSRQSDNQTANSPIK